MAAVIPKAQHEAWMLENLAQYEANLAAWENGVARGAWPFQALLDAKDSAAMVHLNALDSDNPEMARKAMQATNALDDILLNFLAASSCSGRDASLWWSKVSPSCSMLAKGARLDRDRGRG